MIREEECFSDEIYAWLLDSDIFRVDSNRDDVNISVFVEHLELRKAM